MGKSVLIASVAFAAVSVTAAAQAPVAKPASAKTTKSFTPPKTPWGDPDISGNVTNVFEASTPFERPEDFAGRRLEEVQGDELSKFRLDLQKRTLANFEGPLHEMIHETRVIQLDGRPHVGKNVRLDMGDARGHWEGNTLVVETTNFTKRSVYRNANAEKLRLVERFTRVAPDKVMWTVTVDDPSTWTRPWTLGMPLTILDSEVIQPYECHEGNYGLENMLEIARAADKQAR